MSWYFPFFFRKEDLGAQLCSICGSHRTASATSANAIKWAPGGKFYPQKSGVLKGRKPDRCFIWAYKRSRKTTYNLTRDFSEHRNQKNNTETQEVFVVANRGKNDSRGLIYFFLFERNDEYDPKLEMLLLNKFKIVMTWGNSRADTCFIMWSCRAMRRKNLPWLPLFLYLSKDTSTQKLQVDLLPGSQNLKCSTKS